MKKLIPAIFLVLIGVLSYIFLTDNLIFISQEENDQLLEMYFASTEVYIDALSLINIYDEKALIEVEKNSRKLDQKIREIAIREKYRDYLVYHDQMMLWSYRSIETKKEIIRRNDKNNEELFPQVDKVNEILNQEKSYLKKFNLKTHQSSEQVH